MLKFISLRAAIGLLVAVACIAVLAIGVQSWNGAASPLALALTSIAALVLLVGLGALVSRELASALHQFGTAADALGSGDLTARFETSVTGDLGILAQRLNRSLDELGRTVQRMEQAAWTVVQASHEVERDCRDLSVGASEHDSVLSQTRSSMDRLAKTVLGNSEHAQRVTRIATEAESQASDGAEVLTSAIVAMDEIAGSGDRIGEIVAIIDSIAFQTNLLALNAAVEAARAGESGRGFAVVAAEVRNLAQRASASAKEIRELIRSSAEAVEQGEHLVTRTGEAFSEIRGAVLKVNDIVSEIVSASAEQRTDIDGIHRALEHLARASRGSAVLADQAAAAAATLVDAAQDLTESAGRFGRGPARSSDRMPEAPRRALESPRTLHGESG